MSRMYARLRGRIGLLALAWLVAFASVAWAGEGYWRLDEDGGSELPYNFRMATDPWHKKVEGREPVRRGLDTIQASASAQPNLKELPVLYKKIRKEAPNPSQIYLVDLRQESHGFADRWAVSWYEKRNAANQGMTAEAVEEEEARRLKTLLGHKTTFRPKGKSDKARFKEQTFQPKSVKTEREAAQEAGFRYVRFAAADKMWPDAATVERFLAFVNALPKDAWLHFHCHAGHGRTSTFLSMYDILKNPDVSLEDVTKRHGLQGGRDILEHRGNSEWEARQGDHRAEMIRLFYRYASELRTKDTTLSWSKWLEKEQNRAKGKEERQPSFPKTPPGPLDKAALDSTRWEMPPSYTSPLMMTGVEAGQVSILGKAEVPQRQMVRFLERRNPKPKINCTPTELVRCYYEEAGREGIRPDVALCQAFKETGFFNYGGDVLPEQNNFCGLGATGNKVRGAQFASPRLGARAHIQHLLAYASKKRPSAEIVDPRYEHIAVNRPDLYGQVHAWTGLNGAWAVPGTHYGQDILNLWGQAMAPDGSPESQIQASMAIRKNPEDAKAYLARAIAYANGGRTEEAFLDYEESLRLSPSPEALYDRALLYESLGDTKAALADYGAAIERDPKFPQAWYNRGNLYLRLGMNREAMEDFRRSILLIPELSNAYVAMGILQIREKQYASAWESFYRAGDINSSEKLPKANQKLMMACVKAAL